MKGVIDLHYNLRWFYKVISNLSRVDNPATNK